MKKTILSLALAFIIIPLLAQEVKLKLTVYNDRGQPMTNTAVNFIEVETRELITARTDAQGVVNVHFTKGKLWQINILKIVNNHMWQVVMPTVNGISQQQRKVTYDYAKWERENRPPVNRALLNLQEVVTENKNVVSDRVNAIKKISILKHDRTPLRNFKVSIVCYKLGKIFTSQTNMSGEVSFKVPPGNEFQVDLGGIENFTYLDLPNKPGVVLVKEIIFEPCTVPEIVKGDTTIQEYKTEPLPCTGRQAFTLTINENGKGLYAQKVILLKQNEGTKFFQGKTNDQGIVRFLLPMGYTYVMIDRQDDVLSENIPVADLTRAFGKSSGSRTIMISAREVKRSTKVKLSVPKTEEEFYEFFKNNGVTISNFRKSAANTYSGSYVLYTDPDNGLGIKSGILMTTGTVLKAIGPNDLPGATSQRHWQICTEQDLAKLNTSPDSGNFFDACILEFDVEVRGNKLIFEYLIGSEEYGEYLKFDDSFGIFLSEAGSATKQLVTKTGDKHSKISVSLVNAQILPSLFQSNEKSGTNIFENWQYDGFTKKAVTSIPVISGKKYTVKLIIADYHDNIYDTGAFINFFSE